MAKIDVTKTELVWPGKYDEEGALRETPRVNLPFQIVETVNESRAGREARKDGSQQVVRWSRLFGQFEGFIKVYSGCESCPRVLRLRLPRFCGQVDAFGFSSCRGFPWE